MKKSFTGFALALALGLACSSVNGQSQPGGDQPAGQNCVGGCDGVVIGSGFCDWPTKCCINLNCPRNKFAYVCCATANACRGGVDASGNPVAYCVN